MPEVLPPGTVQESEVTPPDAGFVPAIPAPNQADPPWDLRRRSWDSIFFQDECCPATTQAGPANVPIGAVFSSFLDQRDAGRDSGWEPWGSWLGVYHDLTGEKGLGVNRVAVATLEIEQSQPMNNYRLRFDNAYNWQFPDRSEYLWAKGVIGRGPKLPETEANYQDVRFLMELGSPATSVLTELPIRVMDPEMNANHAGLGDMSIAPKVRMLNGDIWQISTVVRTILNTGSPLMGLGTGHVSMDPGLLVRAKLSDWDYLHLEIKYWFALGGDPLHSGQIFHWGMGWSHVLKEIDDFAIISTLEFKHWTALNGLKTNPLGIPEGVDGEHMFAIFPGLRFSYDSGGDLGLCEFAVGGGISTSGHHLFDELLRAEVRWIF